MKEKLTTGQIKKKFADMKRNLDEMKKIFLNLANIGYPDGLNCYINQSDEIKIEIENQLKILREFDKDVKVSFTEYFSRLSESYEKSKIK